MKLGIVGVNLGNVEAYRAALKGLSVEQSVFALTSKGATEEQIRQILVTDQAKLKDVEAAMAKAGLTTATKALNAEELIALATKKGISAERAKEIASALGLIATEKGQVVSKKQLTVATLQQVGATDAEITAILGLNAAETANIGIINVLTASFAKLWAVITAHPIGAILTAIGVAAVSAVAAYNKWGDTLENTKEKLSDLKSECQEIVSDLQAVNSELKTTRQRLEELEGKDTLTFTEKEEYDNLVKINNELQRKIDLLELEEKNKREKQNKTFVSAMKKDTENPFEYEVNPDGKKSTGQYSISDEYLTSETGYIEAQFEIRDQLLEDLANAETEKEKERIQKRIDEIDKYLNDKNDEWKNVSDGIDYIENPTTEDDKEVNEWLDYIADFQDRMAIAMSKDDASSNAQYKTNAFNRVVDNWQFDEVVQGLQDLGKEGKVTAEMLDDPKYDDFINKLVFLGVIDSADNLEDVALAFNSVATSAKNAADSTSQSYTSFSDIFSLKDAKDELTNLGKISESIDTIQNAYKTLNDAIEEYNENGSFSVDTLQSVIELGDDWLDYLVDEEGNLKLDKESLEALTKSRLEDMRVQTINNLIDNVSKINDDVSAKSYLESTNYAVAKSYEELTEKTLAYKRTALTDSGVSEDIADAVIEKAQSDIQKINKLFDNVDLSVESLTGGKGKSTSSTSKSSSDAIDWIETLLSRIQRTITNLGKTVSATYKGWSKRNNALAQEMKEINKEISTQATAYDTYMAKANSVPLSDEYKSLVRNGGFSLSEIKDEALKKNIDLYRQWYEKALNCSDAIEDLRSNLADLAKTKFENVSKQYDNQMLMIDHNIQMLQGFVEQSESAGYMASEVYYQAMAEKQQENIAELQDKYGSLLSAFDEAVKNGSIEKYSEEWYNMLGDINDVEKELQSANTQLIEFNQTLQQLSWDVFDRVRDSISDINSEANFLIDIISRSDLFTDDGQITNEGLAVQGLYAVNYNTYMEQSLAYAEEIKRLNDEIAKDPYDLELIDRKNELIKAQQEAIANANSEKDAIRDLISNGYDKMLNSLDKLISKQKELLNSKKDLYDYENNITNQTKDIANLKKQLEAYKYDNSENAKATIQKLQVLLDEAEAELKETEYEKYISDQEQLLDKLYSDTEQWINERLDDIDGLIIEAVDATNQNAEIISNTINNASNEYSVKLSEKMDAIWNSQENSINGINTVVSIYGDIAHDDITSVGSNIMSAITGGNTNVISAINNVQVYMNQMISELNAIATNNKNTIANTQNSVVNNQNPISSSANIQPNTSKPTNTNNNTSSNSTSSSNNNVSTNATLAAKKAMEIAALTGQITAQESKIAKLEKQLKNAQDNYKYNMDGYNKNPRYNEEYYSKALSYQKEAEKIDAQLVNERKYLQTLNAKKDFYSYKSGSRNISKNQLAWTQDGGSELIYRAVDGAILTPLNMGDKVFTHQMSENLWNLAQVPVPNLNISKNHTVSVPPVTISIDGIEMYGVNDPVEFTKQLTNNLSNNSQVKKIIQDNTIGLALGNNSFTSRKR